MLLSSNVNIANITEKMISILRHLSFSYRGELLKGACWGVANSDACYRFPGGKQFRFLNA